MPTLLLRFPGGRYHATPWGHHVNEGLVEWPPSPWRILRALIACGYATQEWSEVPPAGRRLVEALAATLPSYQLPEATVAHSRHFMPTCVLEKGREKTTLVFDTWANVGDQTMMIRWDCALDDEALALFQRLVGSLGYLGRSESWVLAQALADDAAGAVNVDAYPHVNGQRPGRGWEQVSLMAAELPGTYAEWRAQEMSNALAAIPLPAGRKRIPAKVLKERQRAQEPYPLDLVDCLQWDTAQWKRHRWNQPPGSRRVLYWRRADTLSVTAVASVKSRPPERVAMMLLALTTPSGNRSALPPRTRALPQAELLHRALVAKAGRRHSVDCPELTGRDPDRRPLTGHRHAHILPLDLDGDHRLDHILIYARMGLGSEAQAAVHRLKRTWTKGGVGEVQVALAGYGDLDRLRTLPSALQPGITALLGPTGGARFWRSATPFVLPRHMKARGANTIQGQVLAELISRGLPAAIVETLPWDDATLDLRHAIRVRRHPGNPPPVDVGLAIRLTFDSPVAGPISLGYASHFGLGLFVAEPTTER